MSKILQLVLLTSLILPGCATIEQPDTKVATAECKVVPYQTASLAGNKRPASDIEKRQASGQLATSSYRMAQLQSPMGQTGLVEQALRDCNR